MKNSFILSLALAWTTLTACAKAIDVTIEGTHYDYVEEVYLIVNEDTAHAQRVPLKDGHFKTTIRVNRNDFIRISRSKYLDKETRNVVIADSKSITVNLYMGTVEGSEQSKLLNDCLLEIERSGPGTFHIDYFGDDPAVWEKIRADEQATRKRMEMHQQEIIRQKIIDNADNLIPAWLVRTQTDIPTEILNKATKGKPKWMKHPILTGKKK